MKRISTHRFFITCALIVGSILVFLIPPFQSPDEASHFKKAYVISGGHFYPQYIDGDTDKPAFQLPINMVNQIYSLTYDYAGNLDAKYTYKDYVLKDRVFQDYNEMYAHSFSTSSTNVVDHIIPAIGIGVGKVIFRLTQGNEGSASAVYLLYYARIFNLIAYTAIVGLAIKLTPILKKTMCLIALMPMSIFLAASTSYDVLAISVTFLSLALIFRVLYVKDSDYLTLKRLLFFGFLAFVILCVKMVYVVIFALLFFTSKEKFALNFKKFNYLKTVGIFAGIVIGYYLILHMIPSKIFNIPSVAGVDPRVSAQQAYLFGNPFRIVPIMFNSLATYRDYYMTSTVGAYGLIDTFMPSAFTYLFILYAIAFGIIEIGLSKIKISWQVKTTAIVSLLVGVIGIFTALYLSWTPTQPGFEVGGNLVTGVQGRYFIPLLPLLFIPFATKHINKNKRVAQVGNYVLELGNIVSVALLCVMMLAILLRFWG